MDNTEKLIKLATVKVWEEERRIIARDVLKLLHVKKNGGYTHSKNLLLRINTNIGVCTKVVSYN